MIKKPPIWLGILAFCLFAYGSSSGQALESVFNLTVSIEQDQVSINWLDNERAVQQDSAALVAYIESVSSYEIQAGDSPNTLSTVATITDPITTSAIVTSYLNTNRRQYVRVLVNFQDEVVETNIEELFLLSTTGDLVLAASVGDTYSLSWNALPSDSPNFAYYRLDIDNSLEGLTSIFIDEVAVNEYQVELPPNGTSYGFALSAVDTLGQTHVTISTSFQTEDLLAPEPPTVSTFDREGRSFFVTWDGLSLNEFGDFKQVSIYAQKGSDPCTNPDTYSDCVANLSTDTTILTIEDPFIEELFFQAPYGEYTFFIETEDQSGNTARSGIAYFFDVVDDIPPPFTFIDRVEPGDKKVDVFWVSEVDPLLGYSDIAFYELFLESTDGGFASFFTAQGNERSYQIEDFGLVPGVSFRLSLNAVDSAGNRSQADQITFTMSDLEQENNNFFAEATALSRPSAPFIYGEAASLFYPSLMNGVLESGGADIYSFDVEEGKEYELMFRSFDLGQTPLNEGQLEIFTNDTTNAIITEELINGVIQIKYVSDYTGTAYARVSGENSVAAAGQYQLKLYYNWEFLGREHGGASRESASDILAIAGEIQFIQFFLDQFGSFDGRLASSIYPAAARKYYRVEIDEPDIQLDWIIESRTDLKVVLEDENGNTIRIWDSQETIPELVGGEPLYGEIVKHTFNEAGVYYLSVAASDRNPTATATFMMVEPIFKDAYEIHAVINEISYGSQGNNNAYAPVPYVEVWVPGSEPLDQPFYLDLTVGDTTFYSDFINPNAYSVDPFTGDYYYVITSNIEAFNAVYGDDPSIPAPSAEMPDLTFLSPEGGVIYIATRSEDPIDELVFGSSTGQEWPTAFAGNLGTLELQDANPSTLEIEEALNHKPENWAISLRANGTPFKANSRPSTYSADSYEPNPNFSNAAFLLHLEEDSLTLASSLASNFADTVDWYRVQAMPGDTVILKMTGRGINFSPQISIFEADSMPASIKVEDIVPGLISSFNNYVIPPFESGSDYELIVPLEGNDPNTPFDIWIKVEMPSQGEGTYNLSIQRKYMPKLIGWAETFENSFESFLPPHWTVFSTDGNENEWQAADDLEENEGIAAGIFFNPQQSNDWLVSPILRLNERAELTFETKAVEIQEVDRDFSETYEVWVGNANAGENPSDYFDRVLTQTINNTGFELVTVDLSSYTGQDIRVAIRNISENANLQLIDNVELKATPAYGTLFGKVTRASDNLPLAGATLQIDNQQVTTEANGEYRFVDVLTGTREVAISLQDYQEAVFNVLIEPNAEDTLNVSLSDIPDPVQVYYSGLEDGEDLGSTSSWQRSTSILYEGEEIKPTRNYMLLLGGEQGYAAGNYTNTWISQPINLVDYRNAKLKFKLNQQTEAGDGLKVYLIGQQLLSTFFDTKGDSVVDPTFIRSESTNGWEEVELDISVAAGQLRGNAVRIGFAFESVGETSNGFGVAIDDIEVAAIPFSNIPAVNDLTINCPVESDRVNLTWTAATGTTYQVLRSNLSQQRFEIIGTASEGSFMDNTVGSGQLYTYYVQAVNASGTGYASNEVVAHPRNITDIPLTEELRYEEPFETTSIGFLPQGWSVESKIRDHYRYEVGDSARAVDDFIVYPEKGQFLYLSSLVENAALQVGTQSILASPWMDASAVSSNLLLRFEAIANNQSQQYYVGIKTACGPNWTWIDTLEALPTWTALEYKLNDVLDNESRFRVGFMVEHQNRTDQVNQNQFGIDNLVIGEFNYATLAGTVTNPQGAPVPGAAIFVGDATPYYTDKNGRFVIDSTAELFEESIADIEVVSWFHPDTVARRDVSLQANMQRIDFELLPDLPRVSNLDLAYAQNGDAMLSWDEGMQPGHIILHDGSAEEALAEEGKWFAFKLSSSNISMNYWLEKVAIRLQPRSTNAQASVKVIGQTQLGQPDWGKVYGEQSINISNESSYTIDVDTLVPSEIFVAIKVAEASIPLDYSRNGHAFMSSEVGGNWMNTQTNGGAMIDLYAETGIELLYDYELYKGTQPEELTRIATISRGSYRDTLVNVGTVNYYRVSAKYSTGLSPRSLPAIYDIDTLAWLEVSQTPILVEIPANKMDSTYELQISNQGQDPLDYEVMFEADIPEGRIAGSRMYSYNSLPAGATKEIHIALAHGGNDLEGIRYASIRFPDGISIVQSTIFDVPESGAFLASNGATGQEVQWFSPTGIEGIAPIKAGMTAYTRLTVEVASNFEGAPYFEYTLLGDGRGEGESEVQGRYDMQGLPISVNGNTGTVAAGIARIVPVNIAINESRAGMYKGRILIRSNDANTELQAVPFDIRIGQQQGTIELALANEQSNLPLQGATVAIGNQRVVSNESGVARITGLPTGQYSYKIYHPDYLASSDTITLLVPNQTLRRTVFVEADLPSPYNVVAADSSNRMEVKWEFEASPMPILGFEGVAGEFANAPWLTEKGFYQYSSREAKEGATSLAIRSAQVGDTAILVGPSFTVNPQAEVSFWAKVGGETAQVNEGKVFVIVQLPTGERITVSELTLSNTDWEKYAVDLSNVSAESGEIILGATTIQGSVLYLDDARFNSQTRLASATRNAVNLQLYRAVNGVESLLLDNIDLQETSYIDTQVKADSSYAYRLRAVYNLGNSPYSNRASSLLANVAPTIEPLADANVAEDNALTRELIGSDRNGTALIFSAITDTAGVIAQVEGNILTVAPISDWHGTAQVSAIVSDGSLLDTAMFTVVVAAINDAPRFTSTPTPEVNQGTEYIYEFAFVDPEGDAVTYRIETLPAWLTEVDGSQVVKGTPSTSDIGEHALVIMATDGQDTTRQEVIIQVLDFNYPATFTSEPSVTATESIQYLYNVEVADRDGDDLTVTAPLLPSWLSFDAESLQLSGVPQHNDVGVSEVTLAVSDGQNTTEQSFSIAVQDTNQAPVFTSNPILTVEERDTYLYNVTASDPDGDPVTLSAVSLPEWLSFSGSTGLLTGVPNNSDIGESSVILRATDTLGYIQEQAFTVEVTNKNDAPEFTSTPLVEAIIEQAYIYAVTASDQDGDTITFAAEEMPSWLTLETAGIDYAILSGIPFEEHLGDSLVSLTATDGKSEPAKQLFFLKVGSPTGLGNAQLESQISLYPNPAVEEVTLSLPTTIGKEIQVWLFNTVGKLVHEWPSLQPKKGQLQLPLNYQAGKYLLMIKAGDKWAVKHLIIQR